jgi:3-hydroxyacyl-CoA dehydrogenase
MEVAAQNAVALVDSGPGALARRLDSIGSSPEKLASKGRQADAHKRASSELSYDEEIGWIIEAAFEDIGGQRLAL